MLSLIGSEYRKIYKLVKKPKGMAPIIPSLDNSLHQLELFLGNPGKYHPSQFPQRYSTQETQRFDQQGSKFFDAGQMGNAATWKYFAAVGYHQQPDMRESSFQFRHTQRALRRNNESDPHVLGLVVIVKQYEIDALRQAGLREEALRESEFLKQYQRMHQRRMDQRTSYHPKTQQLHQQQVSPQLAEKKLVQQSEIHSLLARADELHRLQDFPGAVACYKSALSLVPGEMENFQDIIRQRLGYTFDSAKNALAGKDRNLTKEQKRHITDLLYGSRNVKSAQKVLLPTTYSQQ